MQIIYEEYIIDVKKGTRVVDLLKDEIAKSRNKVIACRFNNEVKSLSYEIDSDGKIIKIEQIRQMQEKILEKPIVSSKKVYVINDADLMTKEAQNCLLKTLEEPPEFVIIILVLANESKILNTVKSRCMRIFFSKLKDEELKKYACREYNEAEIKEGMIKNASGSISKFIKIKENFDEYENLEELVKKLKTDNILDIINNADVLYKNKDKIEDLLDYMTTVFYNWLTKEDNIKYTNIIKIIEIVKRKLKRMLNLGIKLIKQILWIFLLLFKKLIRG